MKGLANLTDILMWTNSLMIMLVCSHSYYLLTQAFSARAVVQSEEAPASDCSRPLVRVPQGPNKATMPPEREDWCHIFSGRDKMLTFPPIARPSLITLQAKLAFKLPPSDPNEAKHIAHLALNLHLSPTFTHYSQVFRFRLSSQESQVSE